MGGLCVIRMALQRANCDFAIIKAEDLATECVTEQIILILTLYHSREESYKYRPKFTQDRASSHPNRSTAHANESFLISEMRYNKSREIYKENQPEKEGELLII